MGENEREVCGKGENAGCRVGVKLSRTVQMWI